MNMSKIILTMIAAALAIGFIGCKKKEQPATAPKAATMESMQKQAAVTAEEANKTAAAATASIEQKNCPVTGDPIDPNVFVEYKGKKVYFCCSMCIAPFNKNPEKYIAKLPQFAK
jgi:YHS domain-containing protein